MHVFERARTKYHMFRSQGSHMVSKRLIQIMSTLLPLRRICSGGQLSNKDLAVVSFLLMLLAVIYVTSCDALSLCCAYDVCIYVSILCCCQFLVVLEGSCVFDAYCAVELQSLHAVVSCNHNRCVVHVCSWKLFFVLLFDWALLLACCSCRSHSGPSSNLFFRSSFCAVCGGSGVQDLT